MKHFYDYVAEKAPKVKKFTQLKEDEKRLYLELLKFSLFQIPFDGSIMVDANQWGVTPVVCTNYSKQVSVLHVVYSLGVYIQSSQPH